MVKKMKQTKKHTCPCHKGMRIPHVKKSTEEELYIPRWMKKKTDFTGWIYAYLGDKAWQQANTFTLKKLKKIYITYRKKGRKFDWPPL